ncbi:PRA1 family protein D-like [Mercurialis annua]|uniref:PRA1 family protein D-like n=1 Tax=Mercurialis annua TaxID=3986 RepID=UPI00215FBDDA|nr:PRA1 family protein D-like [Mercurialis annua]
MSTTPKFISQFKQTTQSLNATVQPWSLFSDSSSLNFPSSLPDATTRITQNLTHFRSNYSLIILISLFLSLIYHPLSLIAFFIILIGWVFLYFARDDDPLTFFAYQVSDFVVLALLFSVTVVVLIWSGVWFNVVAAVGIGFGLVILHALLRSTDDLVADDIETSPYVNLLSDDEFSPRGAL